MLTRLLQHCVRELALDGEEGSDVERLFSFVEAFCAHLPEDARPVLDRAYRAFVWRTLLHDARVHVGVAGPKGTSRGQQRSSILAKGREASSAPTPIESGPLAALVEAHGAALRVYVDAELVRRTLTGTEAPFASAAAYVALQHVYRARERGVTVVELGARTHYDPKTVYYLVKLLLERELVAKFTARETGEVSNYVVGRPFLARNALWQAQQRAAGPSDVGTPAYIDLDTIASEWDDAPMTGEADEDEAGALAMPPLDPHDGDVLAYPMLSDEQSAVWLHSRQDLLSERLARMLRMSPSHMTPRRYLPTRLGLRRVPTLRRGFLAFLHHHLSAGHIERVRVQFAHATPLYIRATDAWLGGGARAAAAPASAAAARVPLRYDATLEYQLLTTIDACGAHGCTMHELAQRLGCSSEVKRMVEQILSRQVVRTPPPYAALAVCAPFEQSGRERRIRYYTARGFAERCAADGLSMSTALGMGDACAPAARVPPVPDTLPGECLFPDAATLAATLASVGVSTGFFRDVPGPVPLRGAKRTAPTDPATGRAKRGRPRKGEVRPKVIKDEPDPAPDPVPPPPPPRAPEPRSNLSVFQRVKLLTQVLAQAGGALDEVEIPRRTRVYLDAGQAAGAAGGDLSDRTTRTKTIEEAVRRGVVRTIKVPRTDDAQRPRTLLHLTHLTPDALQEALRSATSTPETRGVVMYADIKAEHAGLSTSDAAAPWLDTTPVTYGHDDPLDDPSTQRAFARHAHLLRQYYGFPHGSAARLQLFYEAAQTAADDDRVFSLAWFVHEAALRTLVALVPVRLTTPAVVRAVTAATSTPVDAVPPAVARRLGLGRQRAHRQRLATYAAQLVELGLAESVGEDRFRLTPRAPVPRWPPGGSDVQDVSTPAQRQAYWAAVRSAVEASDAKRVPPYLAAPHAWRDTFALRGVQKAFLRRYAWPLPPDALERLASAVFAPRAAVEAFFVSRTSRAHSTAASMAHKVAARQAQRTHEWDAALADVRQRGPPDAGEPRALAQLAHKYIHGRDAVTPAALRQRIAAALGMHRRLRTPTTRGRRRSRAFVWTPEHQATLRDAHVVLAHRQRAWRAMHGAAALADDWSALHQLFSPDAPPSEAAAWRARRRQLTAAPHEQVGLVLVERAWHHVAARGRADGTLPDPAWPHPSSVDLRAHIAYLRRHIDRAHLLQAHAEEAARTVLPRRLTAQDVAAWTPVVPRRASLVDDTGAPMVHRLQQMRTTARSMRAIEQPVGAEASCALATMLVPARVSSAELAAWAELVGAERLERAIALAVERRVLQHADGTLVYTDERQRTLSTSVPAVHDAYRRARAAGSVSVHPAATESETAAWLSLLETGRVRASLDMAPLAALRRRPKLNARTLDDVETECRLTLTWAALPPLPDVRPPEALVLRVSSALAAALERAGPPGVCASDAPLDAGPHRAFVVEGPRLVHERYAASWQVPTLRGPPVWPRAWLDVHGDTHLPVWHARVAHVMARVSARPGTSIEALVADHDRLEVYDIVRACAEARCIAIRGEAPFLRPRHAYVVPCSPWFM